MTDSASTTAHPPVVDALRQVVADSYALLGQTHLCHWNVRGPSFFSLHTAFEGQNTELFGTIDIIIERIRALGAFAPGGLENLARMAGMKEVGEDASADDMVRHLLDANEHLVRNLASARELAADSGDAETEDLMIARTQVHEKDDLDAPELPGGPLKFTGLLNNGAPNEACFRYFLRK
jgi:starvation-inducible DNA-binding protein